MLFRALLAGVSAIHFTTVAAAIYASQVTVLTWVVLRLAIITGFFVLLPER